MSASLVGLAVIAGYAGAAAFEATKCVYRWWRVRFPTKAESARAALRDATYAAEAAQFAATCKAFDQHCSSMASRTAELQENVKRGRDRLGKPSFANQAAVPHPERLEAASEALVAPQRSSIQSPGPAHIGTPRTT